MSELFDFLKYCLGAKSDVNKVITGIDWQMLYSFAFKQALRKYSVKAVLCA